MKRSKHIAMLLCLVMLLSLATACSGNKAPTTSPDASGDPPAQSVKPPVNVDAPKRDTLNIAVDSDPGTLNPGYMAGQTGLYNAMECVYEPLWIFSESDGLEPVLMDSYEIVEPDHWVVKLREDVTFSNGNKFDADDVMFTFEYMKTVGSNAVRAQSIDMERTKKIDDYTIDLYMPGFYLMHETSMSMMLMFDSESFDETSIVTKPVGTGPYAVKEYVTNSHLFLEKRDGYWGDAPEIQNLNFRVMAEPSQIVNALSTNTIDIGRVALSDYAHVETFPGYNMNARNIGGGVQVAFNAGHKGYFNYFDKDPQTVREARYAIIHAIDPQVIIDVCYEGRGREMHCYSPDFCLDFEPAFDDIHETYSIGYDVELARQYAQSSGLAGQTITLMTNGLPTMRTLAEILQNMLAEIDVTLVINNTDPGTYQTSQYDAEADYDIRCTEGIAPNWRICDGIVNSVRYSGAQVVPGAFPDNEHYLQIAPLTITTADPEQRREYLLETLTAFVENAIAYAVCIFDTAYAVSSDIDMDSVRFNLCSGQMRFQDIKWA